MKRYVLTGAAVLACIAVGVGFLLLALDVARARAAFVSDDVRYRSEPGATLWAPTELVPAGAARRILAVDDDLLFRRALRGTLLGLPAGSISDPAYVVHRSEATAWLTDIVQSDGNSSRRSVAANLLGVLTFSDAITDYENRGRLLESSAGRFRQAIAFDPENEEAKYNLELALNRSQGLELAEAGGGTNPSPGGRGSSGAGAGDPGSGY